MKFSYLYGRGVSDNKGPVLALACAAANLQQQRDLDVDLIMLIEGEEEAGSRGFAATVRKYKVCLVFSDASYRACENVLVIPPMIDLTRTQESIGHIDVILLSNSTWVGEDDPCVVFGMRGVVYAHLEISNQGDDAHSGVDGGSVAEPMFDMIRVLGSIADDNGVKLPGFCELGCFRLPADANSCHSQTRRSDLAQGKK